MLRVDAFASQPHYHDHIQAIWEALDADGDFYVTPNIDRPGTKTRGIPPDPAPLIVAGYPDYKRTRRPVIFIEHGAGENYGIADPHYSGGPNRDRVILFLSPNRKVHDANKARYPGRSRLVGSPRLESLRNRRKLRGSTNGRLRVAVSFHWNCRIHPQAGTGLFDFQPQLKDWASDSRIELRGHAHPRIEARAQRLYAAVGIPWIPTFDEVVDWADVYAVDNSSTLWEAVGCGLDVVLLNARAYTAEETGWRFWKHAGVGPQIGVGDSLPEAAIHAIRNRVIYDEARGQAVTEIFGAVPDPIEATTTAIRSALNVQRDQGDSSSAHPRTHPT